MRRGPGPLVSSSDAGDRAFRLQLGRDTRSIGIRPGPPRAESLTYGVLLWSEPADLTNVTHYRVYGEAGRLFAQLPAGQTKLVGFDHTQAIITSFDSRTNLESQPSIVQGTSSTLSEVLYTLTEPSTDILSLGDAPVGTERRIVIETDSTDGRQIVWADDFRGVTADDIDNGAYRSNNYSFWKRADGNWWRYAFTLGIDITPAP